MIMVILVRVQSLHKITTNVIARKLDLTPDNLRLKIPDKYKDDTSSVKPVTEDN